MQLADRPVQSLGEVVDHASRRLGGGEAPTSPRR
jgi:hypothetical protein